MFYFLLFVILVGIDQLTKYLAVTYLEPVGSMPFIPYIMELRFVLNDGSAFGLFGGQTWFLIGVTSVALLGVVVYIFWKKPTKKIEMLSLILILSGGVGNLIDRILNGVVVDFFATTFINFAVFNMADCFVVVGTFLLAAYIIWDEVQITKQKKSEELSAKNETEAQGEEREAQEPEEIDETENKETENGGVNE